MTMPTDHRPTDSNPETDGAPGWRAELTGLTGADPLRRRGFLAAGFAAAVAPHESLRAQVIRTGAEGLEAGEVRIDAGDGFRVPAYRAMPRGDAARPVILVVHEAFGVHEHIRDVCRRFAHAGFLAIAPDCFARQGDATRLDSIAAIYQQVISRVSDAQVLSDLDAAVRWAGAHGGDARRLSITGFCWGGRVVWMYAAHQPNLKAGVAWYGRLSSQASAQTPTHPLDVAENLRAPVLGLYGGRDDGIHLSSVEEMKTRLSFGGSAAQASDIHVYPEAPHAFYADYRPSYRPADAQDAWTRCLAWLRRHGAA